MNVNKIFYVPQRYDGEQTFLFSRKLFTKLFCILFFSGLVFKDLCTKQT